MAGTADPCDALVLFGITGDLANKKLFPALYDLAARQHLEVAVVGVARSDWTNDRLRTRAEESIRSHVDEVDEAILATVLDRLDYVQGDYNHEQTYRDLRKALGEAARPLAYLAIPPSLFDEVIQGLAGIGCNVDGGIVVEKPFGRDLTSAAELDRLLQSTYPEERIFRIDHFLGKETVLDLLMFRVANPVLDTILDRQHVDHVQITMAESFGVEDRGGFYDTVGAMRDVVQNHLLQVASLVAAELPVSDDAEALRDEKAKVLRALRPLDPDEVVRGQYVGYRKVDGVDPHSDCETFVSLIARFDTWRWSGIPFHIRTGKALEETRTEVAVVFQRPPLSLYRDSDIDPPAPNTLRFRIKPGGRVDMGIHLKKAGDRMATEPVLLSHVDDEALHGRHTQAYARLLGDAIEADRTLFARSDSVMAAWAAIQPILESDMPCFSYEQGSSGPQEAARLAPPGGWLAPVPD